MMLGKTAIVFLVGIIAPSAPTFAGTLDRVSQTGKLADLIVLDQNLFDIGPNKIHKTTVLFTMMDGKVWHDVLYGWGDSNLVDQSVTEIDIDFEGKRDP